VRPLVAAVLVLGCAPAGLADDGLRCGRWLVVAGADQAEVAAKCGPPTHVATRHERRRFHSLTFRSTVDLWTYDRGPYEFVRTLTFADGILQSVTVGDYGGR
jgi:hypothetical protein